MNRRYFYFSILLLIILGLWFVMTDKEDELIEGISIENKELKVDEKGIKTAVVVLKNNTETVALGLEVIVQFLDEKENILDSSTTRIDSISAGKTWTAMVPVKNEIVFDFKIVSITTTEDIIN